MDLKRVFGFLGLVLILILSSCADKNTIITDIEPPDEIVEVLGSDNQLIEKMSINGSDGLILECFEVQFPFDLIVNGTNTETIHNDTDFSSLLNSISNDAFIDFVYPIVIKNNQEDLVSIPSGEALGQLFASCVPDDGWTPDNVPAYLICDVNSCYQLIYPFTLNDGINSLFNVANEEEFIQLITTQDDLFFEFPFDVEDIHGEIITINHDIEFLEILFDCYNFISPLYVALTYDGALFGCFNPIYPVTVQLTDFTTLEIQNDDELFNNILNGFIYDFTYPISLFNVIDSTTILVNSTSEFQSTTQGCFYGNDCLALIFIQYSLDFDPFFGCYNLDYPFDVILEDESILTIRTAQEAEEAVFNLDIHLSGFNYPINAVFNGVKQIINNNDDLMQILTDCDG